MKKKKLVLSFGFSTKKNILTPFIRKNKGLPLNYNRYLIGRSYQLFTNAIRSRMTLQLYKQHLFHFCNFIQMTTEEIVSKYGGGENTVREYIKLQHSGLVHRKPPQLQKAARYNEQEVWTPLSS